MTAPRSIIVTASDAAYFDALCDLVASLDRPALHGAFDIGVIDAGLGPDQRDLLTRGGIVLSPMLDPYDFPGKPDWLAAAPGFLATLERPLLPRHFPGYNVYLHLDADSWVQVPQCLPELRDLALGGRIAIVPEVDRCYRDGRGRMLAAMDDGDLIGSLFGAQEGRRMGRRPRINSGIFALAGDSDIWRRWQSRIEAGLPKVTDFDSPRKLVEQGALNVILHLEGVPAALLPATWNWLVLFARPAWDPERRLLVEPEPPHAPIRIVHLSHAHVGLPVDIPVLGRPETLRLKLGFRTVRRLRRRARDHSGGGSAPVRSTISR